MAGAPRKGLKIMSEESRYYEREFNKICEQFAALGAFQKNSDPGKRLIDRGILLASVAQTAKVHPKFAKAFLEGLAKRLTEAGCDDPLIQELVQ